MASQDWWYESRQPAQPAQPATPAAPATGLANPPANVYDLTDPRNYATGSVGGGYEPPADNYDDFAGIADESVGYEPPTPSYQTGLASQPESFRFDSVNDWLELQGRQPIEQADQAAQSARQEYLKMVSGDNYELQDRAEEYRNQEADAIREYLRSGALDRRIEESGAKKGLATEDIALMQATERAKLSERLLSLEAQRGAFDASVDEANRAMRRAAMDEANLREQYAPIRPPVSSTGGGLGMPPSGTAFIDTGDDMGAIGPFDAAGEMMNYSNGRLDPDSYIPTDVDALGNPMASDPFGFARANAEKMEAMEARAKGLNYVNVRQVMDQGPEAVRGLAEFSFAVLEKAQSIDPTDAKLSNFDRSILEATGQANRALTELETVAGGGMTQEEMQKQQFAERSQAEAGIRDQIAANEARLRDLRLIDDQSGLTEQEEAEQLQLSAENTRLSRSIVDVNKAVGFGKMQDVAEAATGGLLQEEGQQDDGGRRKAPGTIISVRGKQYRVGSDGKTLQEVR